MTKNTKLKPKLLLHTCCAPCFSSVHETLKDRFDLMIFWFNPNIYPVSEYKKRLDEIIRYSKITQTKTIIDDDYKNSSKKWDENIKEFAYEPEGGKRCKKCFEFRLKESARVAKNNNFDYFCTTLTVSPHKNAQIINKVGNNIMDQSGIAFFEADFKKNNGYERSVILSKQFNFYRQNYCGCKYSIRKK